MNQIMITAEEAVAFSQYLMTYDVVFAMNIQDAILKAYQKEYPGLLKEFSIAAIFNAGRVQGIREERRKQATR